jgi:hypothetical protein
MEVITASTLSHEDGVWLKSRTINCPMAQRIAFLWQHTSNEPAK